MGLIPKWGREKNSRKNFYLSLKYQISESKAEMAAQVARDIRSPLAALGAAAKGLEIPEEQRKVMENSANCMQSISDDLLVHMNRKLAAKALNNKGYGDIASANGQSSEKFTPSLG